MPLSWSHSKGCTLKNTLQTTEEPPPPPTNQQRPREFTVTDAVDTCVTAPFDLHVGLQQIERKIASGYAKSTREMYCVSLNASFLPVSAE